MYSVPAGVGSQRPPKPPEYQVGFTPKTSQIERECTEAQEAISHAARSQTC